MVTLELSVKERVLLTQYVNSQQGDLREMRRWLDILGKLELSEEERISVGWQEVEVQPGVMRQLWDDLESTFPIEFEDIEFKMLAKAVHWKQWRIDRGTLSLLEKLDQAKEELELTKDELSKER